MYDGSAAQSLGFSEVAKCFYRDPQAFFVDVVGKALDGMGLTRNADRFQ